MLVAWPFAPLAPGESARRRGARASPTGGDATAWSEPLARRGGLPRRRRVGRRADRPRRSRRARRSRSACARRFTLDAPVRRATLFWTALGVAEPELNGAAGLGRRALAGLDELPRPARARDRRRHRARAAGRERARRDGRRRLVHREVRLLRLRRPRLRRPAVVPRAAARRVRGRHRRARSPTGRRLARRGDGPVVDIRHLRRRAPGPAPSPIAGLVGARRTTTPRWAPVRVGRRRATPGYENVPVPEARIAPPVRRIETLPVAEVLDARRPAASILDFGQNLVGRLRAAGARDPRARASRCGTPRCSTRASWRSGRCGTRHPRRTFDLAGDGEETLESRFTFHGFRYAQIDGWPGEFDPAAVEAVVLHTDMTRTGWFESSARAAQPPARERRVGHARQLPLDPDRLPAARRAPRLDGRHPGLQPDRELPLRLRRLPHLVAARPRARAGARRTAACPSSSPPRCPAFGGPAAGGGVGRCRDRHAVGAARALRRSRHPARRSTRSMRDWVDAVLRVATDGLWAHTFQLGDWLDPAAPPDKPGAGQGRLRHRRERVPGAVAADRRRHRGAARRRRRMPRRTRALAETQPRRVRGRVRDARRGA